MNEEKLARDYAFECAQNAGCARGLCAGIAGIVFALLYQKTHDQNDRRSATNLATACIDRAGDARGLCYGLAAIVHVLLI
jgi:hypothetical protein